jgi:hypothetical protein
MCNDVESESESLENDDLDISDGMDGEDEYPLPSSSANKEIGQPMS